MKRTIARNEMRQKLMNNAMHLVVEEGFSNLTTKKVAQSSGLAEIYIYRYFESKTDLLEQCFLDSEEYFGEKIQELFSRKLESDVELHAKASWYEFWEYLMNHRDVVIFCSRFYHSSYYNEEMLKETRELFVKMMKDIRRSSKGWSVSNKDYAEKNMIVQYIVNVTVSYAVRILQGEMEHTEEVVEFIYHRIVPPVLNELKVEYMV